MGRHSGLAHILVPGLVALFACPGDAEVNPRSPEAASRAASGWVGRAVLVGIADYPGTVDDVDCLDDDALDMREALLRDEEHWADSNITLLLDSQATKANIRLAIESMAAAAGPDDHCIFMFSGHGAKLDRDVPPIDELDGQDEALCPYDFSYTEIVDDELADWLAGFTSDHICVIITACYAGGMAKGPKASHSEGWAEGFGRDLVAARGAKAPRDIVRTGLVALLSSDDDEYSWADERLKDSIFVFYLVEALEQRAADADGDGYVSAEEMFFYAAPCVTKWQPDQTPVMYDAHEGDLPVALRGKGTLARPVTRADLPLGGAFACAAGLPTDCSAPAGLLVGLLALAALRSNRKRALCIALVCAAVVGCGAGLPALTTSTMTSSTIRAPLVSSDADVQGTQPQGATEAAKGRRFFLRPGLRAGLVVPVAAEHASYVTAPLVGLYAAFGPRRLQAEAGVDFFALEGEKVEVEAEFIILRLDVVLAVPASGAAGELYFLAGPRYVADYATTYWYSRHYESSLSVGFGVGFRSPAPGWDARLSADFLLDSSNIGALVSVLGGFTF